MLRAAILVFIFVWLCYFQTIEVTSDEVELRRQSFQRVWQTVNDKHYDETFGGVDWEKIRQIYEPRAMQAKTRREFHQVLNQMVAELRISHIGILEEAEISELISRSTNGVIGIDLKMIGVKAIISCVETGSSAQKAGLKTGYAIEKIDGKPVDEILRRIEGYLTSIRANDRMRRLYQERFLQMKLKGEPGTKVFLEVSDEKGKRQNYEIERVKVEYQMSEPFGNLPSVPVVFESRRLDNRVGYIRFNNWTIPQIQKLRTVIRGFSDTKGIILDLRGNTGGIAGIAAGLAGLLIKEKISLGTMKGRGMQVNLIAYPQENSYSGKVVILVDHGTGSTSEIFAIGLQENGRAKVVGEQTIGASLPSFIEILPTKALFQYPIMDYRSPRGVLVEGKGVTPDIQVFHTRKSLLEGRDLPLEVALQEILRN